MKEREKMKRNKLITLGALLTSSLIVALPLISCSSVKEETIPPVEPPTKPTTPLIPLEPAKRMITAYNHYGHKKVFEVSKIKYGVSGNWKKDINDKGINLNFISYEDDFDTTSISKLVKTSFYITDKDFNDLYKAGNTGRVDFNLTDAESDASFNGSKYTFNLEGGK